MLSPRDQFPVSQTSLATLLMDYDISNFSYTLPQSGIENTTVIINLEPHSELKFVLRIYRQNKKLLSDIQLEVDFVNYLNHSNIPTPKFYSSKYDKIINQKQIDGKTWTYILMEFIDGQHPKEYTPKLISNLARTQAKMHNLSLLFREKNSIFKKQTEFTENQFIPQIDIENIDSIQNREFTQRAKSFQIQIPPNLPFSLNHLDLHLNNILRNSNDLILGILDFDDLAYTPTVMCLGNLLWDIYSEHKDINLLKLYIEEYTQIRNLDKNEKVYLKDFILLKNYTIGALKMLLYGSTVDKLSKYINQEQEIMNFTNLF